jgi:hypothetical protein
MLLPHLVLGVNDIRKEFPWMQSIAGGLFPHVAPHVRDNRWLGQVLNTLWTRHFADTPRANRVRVEFGSAWKTRLGLITLSDDQATSYIQVNSLFQMAEVPDYVVQVTVAHEMVHYAHGFGSPLPRRYKHPHRGGIVKRELLARGMRAEYEQYDDWIYNRWYEFYEGHVDGQRSVSEVLSAKAVASRLPPD